MLNKTNNKQQRFLAKPIYQAHHLPTAKFHRGVAYCGSWSLVKTTKKRDFSDFSSVRFNNDLSIVDWDNIKVSKVNSVDDQFSSFYKQLNKVVQKHAPLKVVSKRKIKQLAKPWITKGIRTSIKIKNRFYKYFIKLEVVANINLIEIKLSLLRV